VRAIDAVCGLPAMLLTWALWVAFALGYFGLHGWVFDVFANFRVQYMVLFALCVVVLTIVRRRKTALVALGGVVLTTATMAPYFQELPALTEPAAKFRLLTFNVWNRNGELERALEFLQRSDADVLILQEVNLARLDVLAQRLAAYPHRASVPMWGQGVAVFSRWPLRTDLIAGPAKTTRIARATLDWDGVPLTVFGVHLSWPLGGRNAAMRAAELEVLANATRNVAGPVLLAGDFNLTPWSRHHERFTRASGLIDCAIGQGLAPTWPSQAWPARIRIDLCFASPHWRVREMYIGPGFGSDHLPVIIDLELRR